MIAFETICDANTEKPYFLNYYNDNTTGEYTLNCKIDSSDTVHFN